MSNDYQRHASRNNINEQTVSYWHENGKFSFLNLTVGDLINKAADIYSDDIAFVLPFQNIRKTYSQLKKDVNQLATGFISLGLQKGDRLAIWSPNCYEWILTQFAAAKTGLILVTINPAYQSIELEHALQKVQCHTVVIAKTFKTQNYYQILCNVLPEISSSKPGQIYSQKIKSLRNVIIIADEDYPGTYSFKELMKPTWSENCKALNEREKMIQFDDPVTIMFTSGTTGTPKGITLSHFNIINAAVAISRRLGFHKQYEIVCLQVPLFHSFGFIGGSLMTVVVRSKCVIAAEHFNSVSSLKAIEEEKCTIMYGTPTMFINILQELSHSTYNISHLKKVQVGASPVPDELMKQLREKLGLIVLNGYGSTEISGGLAISQDSSKRSCGKPIEHSEVKIVDRKENIVPINTMGELLVRSNYVFLGYWDDKNKTEEVIDKAGWYHTGDVGMMDKDGCLYITGRIKDIIIRGGENIYPQEIENFLLSNSAIVEVYVIGIPDPKMGEEICACIQLKSNEKITEQDIKKFCQQKISHFKIPRYIIFFEDYPKTESGKIQKYKLREECIKLLALPKEVSSDLYFITHNQYLMSKL